MAICNLNSPLECDNLIDKVIAGYAEKKYITIKMYEDELIINIKGYIDKHPETNSITQLCEINDKPKLLLKFKDN